ncbi:MAG TPA: BLUF domain-containing protein [Variovorax sp.]|jgi:hypothetical protein|nr:BLUF domain-containing protein [Variovorax sp.]
MSFDICTLATAPYTRLPLTPSAMSTVHEILYCSVLAPDQPPGIVGRIVSQARARNTQHRITGLLVFDGLRFCQHVEGARDEVGALMRRIAHDPRHHAVRVVYEGARAQRRYQRFDLGFAQSEGADDMAGIHDLRGQAALDRFLLLRPGFDISG